MAEFEAVLSTIRTRVEPDTDERNRLTEVAESVVDSAERAVAELPIDADVIRVGSTARDTWLAGDRDIDVFVRFPTELSDAELERHGLAVGHSVLPDGREEFAEHPYVTGTIDGFAVDLVPCYRVRDASDIRSSVDRTPFHDEYVQSRLTTELAGEVRLLKAFLEGIGVYGSDLRTRGFSGYLAELLALHYGDFRAVIEAAADWSTPVRIDPEGHGTVAFDAPLVVVDPTDPERNVAAVCSATNVARFQHHARALLASPTVNRFESDTPEPVTGEEITAHLDRRGTTPVAITVEVPPLVDDQLYPQLRRSLAGITGELDRRGFDVLRAGTWATERPRDAESATDAHRTAVLFVELAVAERPTVERHNGPPLDVRDHAETFYSAYADDEELYGPFIDDGRYVVERDRSFATAVEFLESDAIFDVTLGAHVETALETDRELYVGKEIDTLVDDFGVELARYFDPAP